MEQKGRKPKKCISVKEARELQADWCNTRAKDIEKCMGFEDTREFYWSVEELEDYLKYVKKESRKQGIKDPGIRMYFGAYPKEKCPKKKGYATVFLAPTGSRPGASGKDGGVIENNYEIDGYNWGNSGHPPKIY